MNKFFLQIVLCCHIDHLANISTVPVSFDVDKLVDNQDYDVFTHWNAMARQQGYQQIKERVHAENVELMKVRYDLLKLIEILIHIYKTDPDADLSVFVDQLKSAKNTWIQSLREFRTIQPIQVYVSCFLTVSGQFYDFQLKLQIHFKSELVQKKLVTRLPNFPDRRIRYESFHLKNVVTKKNFQDGGKGVVFLLY